MSKKPLFETSQTSENPSNAPRSSEREALAEAIRIRDEAEAEDNGLKQVKARAAADRFMAARDVEAAERALANARKASRTTLVDAYAAGEDIDDRDVADAESALTKAQRRLADLQTIADELAAHQRSPGYSVPNTRVGEAARAVIKSDPAVRRLAQDFALARRTFETHQSTLRWLASLNCIPEDLRNECPKTHDTFFVPPSDAWKAAAEALTHDPDAALPE
jgi:hypothetical protein